MAQKESSNASPLTQEDLEYFQSLLLAKRQEILGNVRSMEEETLRRERTDLSNMPLHMGDMGSDTFEVDNSLTLVDSERRLLEEIDQALERIANGTYGICMGSGKPIGKKRLQAIPWAKYCIEYAAELEKSGPRPTPHHHTEHFPDEDAA